jgi:hypothetical protein
MMRLSRLWRYLVSGESSEVMWGRNAKFLGRFIGVPMRVPWGAVDLGEKSRELSGHLYDVVYG